MTPPLPQAFLDRPIAHRALHDGTGTCPENSLTAIRRAVDAGFGIEVDVQLTADNQAVVFHDDGLERLTGPTLAACLVAVAGRGPLLIEVLDQDGQLGADVGALEQAVAADLVGYAGPVAVMSFNPHSVAAMLDLAPGVCRGLTTCAFDEDEAPGLDTARRAQLAAIADFDRVGAAFVSHDRLDLDTPALPPLKARGVPVLCWTVRSAMEEQAARRVADQITFEGYTPA